MNRNIMCTRSALCFLKRSCANDKFISHRCLTQLIKPNKLCERLNVRTPSMIKSLSVSSSNSDLKSSETDDPNQNVLDNEEFQNILKDFSKDFGLGSDSENLLNDIKKSLDESNDGDDHAPPSVTDGDLNTSSEKSNVKGALFETYKEFSDSDSVVIQSCEDIVSGCAEDELMYHVDQSSNVNTLPVHTKRGISGVFDIAEFVEVIRNENLLDIAVISIPKELHYADFLVLANAKSPRHSKAVSEYVIKLYKMKKHKKDPFILVEGESISNWKALDMGNIVLHIFLEETRAFYDIESLWLFDTEFDSGGTLNPDPVFDALQEQMEFFNSLQSSSKETNNECIKDTT